MSSQIKIARKIFVGSVRDKEITKQIIKKDLIKNIQIKKEKLPISQDNFNKYFANKSNYTILNASNQFLKNEVNAVLIAIGKNYAIEFYDMASDNIALNICKNIMESNELPSTPENNKYMEYYYEVIKNEMYFILSKVDNTIIFTYAPKEYKEEIKTLMNNLEY
ncbi:hypothetical protein [Anaerocolumna cellulosilytica]|uniref:hypothetical protein n=1 Tax=Anaerocolumna cellulosilytica TaxID=433286 RepID=UPI0016127CB3|nr:hypothetical protein [Anaerocolumna cellulosilytica]MBB5197678.1 hypothetical protein [Anaerocolumna cellulosilytica]